MKIKATLRHRIIPLLIILAALTGSGWIFLSCLSHSQSPRNVLLISIDTCRADHLGCYGYAHNTTPHIDQLAQQGILFTHTYTPVPMTLPAHSSMLTGTIPPYHGVHDNFDYRLARSNETLAEILGQNGFTTGAVVSSFVLDSQFGLNQGFSYYNDRFEKPLKTLSVNERRGKEASRFAIEWLDKHKSEKFFLFLHYYDPHAKYIPPEPFASRFQGNPYAGEIAYTDDCIGHVIAKLKAWGLFDSTLIVITGDHGEMLGEHGEMDHRYFIYQSALRVPLIFKPPGPHKAVRITAPAGIIDIVPTVCGLLGIKIPEPIQGRDLSGYFNGEQVPDADRCLYCESLLPTKYDANSLMGVVGNRWKYIQTTRPELYDIVEDPGETHNLITQQPQRARILQDRLRRILEGSVRKDKRGSRTVLDEEGRRRLESLGYVAGNSVRENFSFDQTREDPKDLIEFHNLTDSVAMLIAERKYREAEATCEKMIKQRPRDIKTHYNLAKIACARNDFPSAVSDLTEAVRIRPDDPRTHFELATVLFRMKNTRAAVREFHESIRLNPEFPCAYFNLANALVMEGRFAEAITYYSEALRIDPGLAEAHNSLGFLLEKEGRIAEAIKHYSETLRIDPKHVLARNNLKRVLALQAKQREGDKPRQSH